MSFYRIVIPYGVPDAERQAKIRRFSAELNCQTAGEARKRGVAEFQELRLATGLRVVAVPQESDVFIDEVETRLNASMELTALEFSDGVYCMKLSGPLDSQTAMHLDREVYRLQQQGCKSLSIDLGLVHPIGSAGLGVLLNLNDRLKLRLIRVPTNAMNMMQMLGLESAMQIYRTFPDALSA